MICPFCSLLCDQAELWQTCELRTASINRLAQRSINSIETHNELVKAKDWLKQSEAIFVTGRFTSAQTSRAALSFARNWNATIDGSESGASMDVALATSQAGSMTVSLAEARDLSDVIVILGDDQLQASFPLLAQRLKTERRQPTILLLGQFSERTRVSWLDHFQDVWIIPCLIDAIPEAVRTWSQVGTPFQEFTQDSAVSLLWNSMRSANYVSFLWSAICLPCEHRDLWLARLFRAVLDINQNRRAGSLGLAGLDAVFQQVCTWTTGFPGRVSFQKHAPKYRPIDCGRNQWICENEERESAMIIEIDESPQNSSVLELTKFQGRVIRMTALPISSPSESTRSIWLPTTVAGYDETADLLRADQVVLARVKYDSSASESDQRNQLNLVGRQSASHWLESLGQ